METQFVTSSTGLLIVSVSATTIAAVTGMYGALITAAVFLMIGSGTLGSFLLKELNTLKNISNKLEEERNAKNIEKKEYDKELGQFGIASKIAKTGMIFSTAGILTAITTGMITIQSQKDSNLKSNDVLVPLAVASGAASLVGFLALTLLGSRVSKLVETLSVIKASMKIPSTESKSPTENNPIADASDIKSPISTSTAAIELVPMNKR